MLHSAGHVRLEHLRRADANTAAFGLDAAFPAVLLALALPVLADRRARRRVGRGRAPPFLPAGLPVLAPLGGPAAIWRPLMPLLAVVVLAAPTYAFRIAGPLLAGRVTVPAAGQRLFTSATAVLLGALAATSARTTGHDFARARPAGVLVAGVLAARRAPCPVVVLVAATVTALLRLAGIH